jgi:hypothetical protein
VILRVLASAAAVTLSAALGACGRPAREAEPVPQAEGASARVGAVRVARPRAPRPYRRPARAIVVRDGRQLAAALGRRAPTNIVLRPGRYTPKGSSDPYFVAEAAHRLFARRRGRAVLRAGLVLGGNFGSGGALVQGLAFDIAAESATDESSAIHVWGVAGRHARILDATFRGSGVLESAIRADEVEGLTVRRVVVRGFRKYGVFASDNDRASGARARSITDVDVRGVKEPVPGSDDGRAEYGLWIGNAVASPVARVRIRDFGWAGLWTGNNAHDLHFTDLDIDGSARADGNAIYIEHKTRRTVFERFRLGPRVKEGIVSEWDYGTEPTGAGIDNVVRDGVIDTNLAGISDRVGVFVGDGTERMTIRRVRFLHAQTACVEDRGRDTRIQRIQGDCPER